MTTLNEPWPFLMSPAQWAAQAASLRAAGRHELAQQADNLAKAIERRQADAH